MKKNALISIIFSALLLAGLAACLICDISISGALTWSLIPASSIIFVWLVCFPPLIMGKRGAVAGLISLSVFTVPYLFALSVLTGVREVFSVGAVMAVASIVFLWIVAAVFSRVGKTDRLAALGAVLLTAVPFVFAVNILLSKMISEPVFDIWDMLTVLLLLILSCACFLLRHAGKKGK